MLDRHCGQSQYMMVVVIALYRTDMVADLIYMMVIVLPWRSDK